MNLAAHTVILLGVIHSSDITLSFLCLKLCTHPGALLHATAHTNPCVPLPTVLVNCSAGAARCEVTARTYLMKPSQPCAITSQSLAHQLKQPLSSHAPRDFFPTSSWACNRGLRILIYLPLGRGSWEALSSQSLPSGAARRRAPACPECL